MQDFLATGYVWVKWLHIISIISWMAGLFYLPRLFVYHVERVLIDSDTDELFKTMERRLLKAIMTPAMIASWVFGVCLVATPGIVDWGSVWPWVKLVSVVGMTVFHMWLGRCVRLFAAGQNQHNGRTYRIMNEVPTLLMLVIVAAVVVKF